VGGLGVKILLVSPGAAYSTADVEAGLRAGLEAHGVEIVRYRLTERISRSRDALGRAWKAAHKTHPEIPKPTVADVMYDAAVGIITMALRQAVDVVVVITAMFLHPDILVMLRRAGLRVVVLFTETPYDLEHELDVARVVTGCWTMERSAVEAFRAVNPRSGFLPAAWHPATHTPGAHPGDDQVRAHDVVFVGSGWPARMKWFESVDWTGIDLGLYGQWPRLGPRHPLRRYLVADRELAPIDNATTAALYRRANIGLNLYRDTGKPAESLNPRAYELAACGVFHVSTDRAEVRERFGDLVPIVNGDGAHVTALLRSWLADPAGRARLAAALPATVADSTWTERARTMIGDLQGLLAADRRQPVTKG
jgi:spore maturation protein CgeB